MCHMSAEINLFVYILKMMPLHDNYPLNIVNVSSEGQYAKLLIKLVLSKRRFTPQRGYSYVYGKGCLCMVLIPFEQSQCFHRRTFFSPN